MKGFDVRAIIKNGKLSSELEYERAQLADRNLMLLVKEDPSMKPLRDELRALLHEYQEAHWRDDDAITDQQFEENDRAEIQAEQERQFLNRRKELVNHRLEVLGLKQKDLAALLGHNKSYTSELLNGVRSFSSNDLALLHQMLRIPLKDLFPSSVSLEVQKRIRATLPRVSNGRYGFKGKTLELIRLHD